MRSRSLCVGWWAVGLVLVAFASSSLAQGADEVELVLDTHPWGHAPTACSLDPEPLYYVPVRDGRVHAIYARGTSVTVTALRRIGALWFDHWSGDVAPGSSAPGSLSWCTLTVIPPEPTSSEKVALRLSGEWTDSGKPNELHVEVLGNTVYLDAIRNYAPGTPFLDVITPWALEQKVGPLAPGAYIVVASLHSTDGGPEYPAEQVGTFTVGQHRDNPLSVLMDKDKALTAHYVEKTTVVLILDSKPWGLAPVACSLDPEPLEILPTDDGRLHGIYEVGTRVAITAHTVEWQGTWYRFDRWESPDSVNDAGSTDNPLLVVMDKDRSIVGVFVEAEEVELVLDADPWYLTFRALTLDPEPIRYELVRDGRIHAIYLAGTEVAMHAAVQIGDLWFFGWSEPYGPLPAIYHDNPLICVLDTDRAFRAHYLSGLPAAPGPLVIDIHATLEGELNPDGPACHSLGIVSIDPNDNPADTRYAIRVGAGSAAGWLRFLPILAPIDSDDVYPDGAEPEWHTAAEWAGKRLRGLQPSTRYTFHAAASNGAGESPLVEVGAYSTNAACDVNRSGLATALDYAYIRSAILQGGGTTWWPCDVTGDGLVNVLDLSLVRSRILNP